MRCHLGSECTKRCRWMNRDQTCQDHTLKIFESATYKDRDSTHGCKRQRRREERRCLCRKRRTRFGRDWRRRSLDCRASTRTSRARPRMCLAGCEFDKQPVKSENAIQHIRMTARIEAAKNAPVQAAALTRNIDVLSLLARHAAQEQSDVSFNDSQASSSAPRSSADSIGLHAELASRATAAQPR